jgi:hypothetical protein
MSAAAPEPLDAPEALLLAESPLDVPEALPPAESPLAPALEALDGVASVAVDAVPPMSGCVVP